MCNVELIMGSLIRMKDFNLWFNLRWIKNNLQVSIASMEEAQSFLSQGMQKRTTAATNANSQSRYGAILCHLFPLQKSIYHDIQYFLFYLGKKTMIIASSLWQN